MNPLSPLVLLPTRTFPHVVLLYLYFTEKSLIYFAASDVCEVCPVSHSVRKHVIVDSWSLAASSCFGF